MKKYRVFSNDRSPQLYSCLMQVEASGPYQAVEAAKLKNPPIRQRWGLEQYHAVEWPAKLKADLDWLDKHVNAERAA